MHYVPPFPRQADNVSPPCEGFVMHQSWREDLPGNPTWSDVGVVFPDPERLVILIDGF